MLPVIRFSKGMRRMTKDAQRQLSGLTVLLQETYQGNRVVKAFGMEEYERVRFNRELRRLFRIYLRVARIKAITGPTMEVMGAFAIVGVIWWGAHSVLAGTPHAGSFRVVYRRDAPALSPVQEPDADQQQYPVRAGRG